MPGPVKGTAAVAPRTRAAISSGKLVVVDSYLDQLYGEDIKQRCLAANALGNLAGFLPRSLRSQALQQALELGVWDALLDIVTLNDDLEVQEAVLVAVSELLTAPGVDLSSPFNKAYAKRLCQQLLHLPVLEQIVYVLTVTSSSRVALSIHRLIGAMSRFVSMVHDEVLLRARLMQALAGVAVQQSHTAGQRDFHIRDSAAAALSALTLGSRTAALNRACTKSGLLQALCTLYSHTIDPGVHATAVLPSDVITIMLRFLKQQPWLTWREVPRAAHQRLMSLTLLSSSAPEVLASYIAVDAGNLRHVLCCAAQQTLATLDTVLEHNRSISEGLGDELASLTQQLHSVRQEEREARDVYGKQYTQQVGPQLQQAKADLKAQILAVRARQEPLQWQTERLGLAAQQLHEMLAHYDPTGASASASEALNGHGDGYGSGKGGRADDPRRSGSAAPKVRRCPPNLGVLTEVLQYVLTAVKVPDSADKGPDLAAEAAVADMTVKMLEGGLLPASLRLAQAAAAARELCTVFSSLVVDLRLVRDMGTALGTLQAALSQEAKQLAAIIWRLRSRIKAATEERFRLSKALAFGYPRGHAGQSMPLTPGTSLSTCVRQQDVAARHQQLGGELDELNAALEDSLAMAAALAEHVKELQARMDAVRVADQRCLEALPPSTQPPVAPPPPQVTAAGSAMAEYFSGGDDAHPAGALVGVMASGVRDAVTTPSGLAALQAMLDGSANQAAAAGRKVGRGSSAAGGPPSRSSSRPSSALSASHPPSLPSSAPAGRPVSAAAAGRVVAHGSSRPLLSAAVRPQSAVSEHRGHTTLAVTGSLSHMDWGATVAATPGAGAAGSADLPGEASSTSYRRALASAKFSPSSVSQLQSQQLLQQQQQQVVGGSSIAFTHSPLRGSSSPSNRPSAAYSQRSSPAASPREDDGGEGDDDFVYEDDDDIGEVQYGIGGSGSYSLAGSGADADTGALLGASAAMLASVRSSAAFMTYGGFEGEAAGQDGGPTLLQALSTQAAALADLLNWLADLAITARTCGRHARLLPASVSYGLVGEELLAPLLPAFFRMQAQALMSSPILRQPIANTVSDIAEQATISPDDFALVYEDSGMLAALVAVLKGLPRPPSRVNANGSPIRPVRPDPLQQLQEEEEGGRGERTSPAAVAVAVAATRGASQNDSRRGTKEQVGRYTHTPPTLRPGVAQLAEQTAAAHALRTVAASGHPRALEAVAGDPQAVPVLVRLCTDHSLTWTARLASAALLASLVLEGGPVAEVSLRAGGFVSLMELLDRDTFPFYRQDQRGSKTLVVRALAAIAKDEQLRQCVVDTAVAAGSHGAHGSSGGGAGEGGGTAADGAAAADSMVAAACYSLQLKDTGEVLRAIVRALWSTCSQLHSLMSAERTGRGKYVDVELIAPLVATATASATELRLLMDEPLARGVLRDHGIGSKINITFLQSIKDPQLYEALVELRQRLAG